MTLEGSNFVDTVGFTPSAKLDNVLVGRYLSLEDNIFVENVISDIQHFLNQEEFRKSVLIFPPVNNYRRFLIHKVSEEIPSEELSTFSIGQGFNRRTVVCVKSLIRKQGTINQTHDQSLTNFEGTNSDKMVVERQPVSSENSSPEHNSENESSKRVRSAPAIYRPPAARKLEALQMKQNVDATSIQAKPSPSKPDKTRSGTRQRRPDIQVYVPRAKRASMMDPNSSESPTEQKDVSPIQSQLLCGMKKNIPVLPTSQKTSSNSSFNKMCCISTPLKIDSENRLISKKGDVDGRVGKDKMVESFKGNQTFCMSSVQDGVESAVPSENVSSNISYKYNSELLNVNKSNTTVRETDDVDFTNNLSINMSLNSNIEASSVREKSKNDVKNVVCKDSDNSSNLSCTNESKKQMDQLRIKKDNINGISDSDNLELILNERICSDRIIDEKNVVHDKEQGNTMNQQTTKSRSIPEILVISDTAIPSQPDTPSEVSKITENSLNTNAKKPRSLASLNSVKTTEKSKPAEDNSNSHDTSTTSVASLNPEECTWDMLFDDNGDCLDPKIMEELTSSVGCVAIEKPQSDYNRFLSRHDINLPGGDDEYSHVVEIYNFPPEFKTQDLLSIFAAYKNGGFEIKWVDDTHALGVFSSSRVAADVLAYDHPLVKTRPLSEATPESRLKAKRSAEFLQPYRPRPETCVALARRLVTGALGMRISTSREEREAERRLLKEAREKRRLAARQQQDAWEGTIR